MFNDKVLLISGGTGSFGNAVLKSYCTQIFVKLEFSQEMS